MFFDICNTEMPQSLSSLPKLEFLKLILSLQKEYYSIHFLQVGSNPALVSMISLLKQFASCANWKVPGSPRKISGKQEQ